MTTVQIEKEITNLTSKLHYITNKDKLDIKHKKYNEDHKEEIRTKKREYDAINMALKMKGLCHKCFCSNVEIYNHKGQIICNGCLQEILKCKN